MCKHFNCYGLKNAVEMLNLEKSGDANAGAQAGEEVSEKALVPMLEDTAQSVDKRSVSWPVVVPKVP